MDRRLSLEEYLRHPSSTRRSISRDIRTTFVSSTPSGLAELQQERLADLVNYCRTHSKFYESYYKDLPMELSLNQIPPVTKHQLMARFDQWVTDSSVSLDAVEDFLGKQSTVGTLFENRYPVWKTSGSTGKTAYLLHDEFAMAVYAALRWVRGRPLKLAGLAPVLKKKGRIAMVIAAGGHYAGSSSVELMHKRFPRMSSGLQLFDVLRPVAELVDELNAFDPAIVIGYATSLEILAEERRGGRLKIEPALVGSVAEVLTPNAREDICGTFGCPVVDEYSTSEFGPITFDCMHGWLHVNSDWVILEPVERDHSPTPAGRRSHSTLLTNLANRVQPLIRYELGDSVLTTENGCPCGSHFPAIRVDGRRDDILRLPGLDGATVPVSPRALGTLLDSLGGVEHYQALQTGPAQLKVRLSFSDGMDPSSGRQVAEKALARFFEENGCSEVELIFDAEPPHRDPATGKYRLIWDARGN